MMPGGGAPSPGIAGLCLPGTQQVRAGRSSVHMHLAHPAYPCPAHSPVVWMPGRDGMPHVAQ